MTQQLLHHRGNYLVRRQRLAPGEASPWHRDPYHRVTVVLSGDLLKIEFRDGSESLTWDVTPGEVVRVAALAQKRVWHDVTNEDQVRVDLTFAGGEQATFLQSDVAAALKPKWYLLGDRGAIVGDWRLEAVRSRAWTGDLVEERLQPGEAPARVRVHRADQHGTADVTELALPPRTPNGFYRNLADHLLLGEPLSVQAAEARRNVAVMEAAARSAAQDGRPLELRA